MKNVFIVALIFALALSSAHAASHSGNMTHCTEADHSTSFALCEGIKTTCEAAVGVCKLAGGSLEAACITAATSAVDTSVDLLTFTDCECDITCSSSMILFSVFALFAKFLI